MRPPCRLSIRGFSPFLLFRVTVSTARKWEKTEMTLKGHGLVLIAHDRMTTHLSVAPALGTLETENQKFREGTTIGVTATVTSRLFLAKPFWRVSSRPLRACLPSTKKRKKKQEKERRKEEREGGRMEGRKKRREILGGNSLGCNSASLASERIWGTLLNAFYFSLGLEVIILRT